MGTVTSARTFTVLHVECDRDQIGPTVDREYADRVRTNLGERRPFAVHFIPADIDQDENEAIATVTRFAAEQNPYDAVAIPSDGGGYWVAWSHE